jgi:hypothetical protein
MASGPSLRKSALFALALVAVVSWTAGATADESAGRTSSLSWVRLDGAESCIGTQELAQKVEKRLKRKVFVSASEADVSVEGHVERSGPSRWHAVITVRNASGELLGTRELDQDGNECSAFDDALVLVVSVLIDPEADLAPEPAKAEAPKPKERVVVRRERVVVRVPAPHEAAPEWRLEAGTAPTVGFGVLPATSWGVSAAVVLEPPRFWGILVTGTYFVPSEIGTDQGAKSELTLAYGGAGLCPLSFRSGRISDRLCAGVAAGALSTRGTGFDVENQDTSPWAMAFVPDRFALRVVGPLALTASASLIVPFWRRELVYRAADGSSRSLGGSSAVAVALDVGLALFVP